jgi:ribonuclease III
MSLDDLQKEINITFRSLELLERAFVHRSHLNEAKNQRISNERLEFLGDSVLSFLTSDFLYTQYPDYEEGTLTNVRSSLVKTNSLADVARTLHLGDLLLLSHGEEASGGRNNPSLLADAFEALLGAIYLDQGTDVARTFLTRYLFPNTKEIIDTKSYVDYKSLLQEIIQQESRISPTYQVIKSEGPDHAKTFWVQATANDSVLGTGSGKSKQEAEQKAALNALEKIGKT